LLTSLNQGTSISGITREVFEKVLISLPLTKSEQTAIATILSDMDNEIAALEVKRDKYRQVKAGMMQELLSGRIRLIESVTKIQPAKIVELKPKRMKHSEQINEAVVISFLVNKFGTKDFPLSRYRYTKYAYLLHRQYEHEAVGFKKHAGGPYKSENRYKGAESIALKNRYIEKKENLKSGKDAFIAGGDIEKALTYFAKWYGTDLQQWIEQFRYYNNNYLEVLTTVDESICDLQALNKPITLAGIKEYISSIPQWKDKLKKPYFNDFNIQKAINESNKLFGNN
jgi:type I restriction enzyme S subunit